MQPKIKINGQVVEMGTNKVSLSTNCLHKNGNMY